MKEMKTSYKMYGAWEFEKEAKAINEEARNGWQLVKCGCFHSKYEKDDSVEYRYQIDYNTDRKDRKRYIETFEEQGWIYINSTFNGWNYFKKVYDPTLPENEYQIYTDQDSFNEMMRRWIHLANVVTMFMVVMEGILLMELQKNFHISILVNAILYLVCIVGIQSGAMIARKKERDRDYHIRLPIIHIMVTVWIVAMVIQFLL